MTRPPTVNLLGEHRRMARSVGPSVGDKPLRPLAHRGRVKRIGCPTRVIHPGPELIVQLHSRPKIRLQSHRRAPCARPNSWPPERSVGGRLVFQVGRNRRGDAEARWIPSPARPLPPASSLPGGHATGVDSGHRPRAVTAIALANVVRPPPKNPRALDGGVQIGRTEGLGGWAP